MPTLAKRYPKQTHYLSDDENKGTIEFDKQVKAKLTKFGDLSTDGGFEVKISCYTSDEEVEKNCFILKEGQRTERITYQMNDNNGLQ